MVRKRSWSGFSYFDINPTKKEPEKRTDLTLFEEKAVRSRIFSDIINEQV